eukprot:3382443-Amphidinium_carterae.1
MTRFASRYEQEVNAAHVMAALCQTTFRHSTICLETATEGSKPSTPHKTRLDLPGNAVFFEELHKSAVKHTSGFCPHPWELKERVYMEGSHWVCKNTV